MLTLGPVSFERQARTPEGAAPFISPEGALIGIEAHGGTERPAAPARACAR